jgi:predicted ribosomally synthesized peptide with SipW-like signal peptide
MTDDPPTTKLTRRRLLAGLTAAGAASAVGGGGTIALLSDTERSTDNTIQAGTVDLVLDGSEGATTTFQASDLAPGDSGTATAPVTNAGSLSGTLAVRVDDISTSGGATVDSENQSESDDDGSALLSELTLEVGFDRDHANDGDLADGDEVVAVDAPLDASDWDPATTHSTGETLSASGEGGDASTLYVRWQLNTDAPNTVQGDEVTVSLAIELEQHS